ncbi:hypothetical protein EPH95_03875 [Salicibibacter halophilus]|uniref:Uncharacterized protein n=1 Tax=Salicibibacter halophilus TaxID=2502791 RepID=A0A514LEZ5_9BACI|nr:hypothetical protein [Salicibibacter halophilus]QDI90426.1 hypothetical protein EPH95_03875 [Salicibibacter halophilus]
MTNLKRDYQDMTDGELAHLIDNENNGIYAYPVPDSEREQLRKEMKAIKEERNADFSSKDNL